MDDLVARRRVPFAIAAAVGAIVTTAIVRLPELFVSQLRRDALLEDARGIWAFRLLIMIAIGQAAYGGYRVLRTERIAASEGDQIEPSHRRRLMTTVVWVAVGLVGLTLVYGVATFALTGLRASFWAFVALIVAQGLWYYRLTGDVARWLALLPAPRAQPKPAWQRGDADYTPPLTRGLGRPPAPAA